MEASNHKGPSLELRRAYDSLIELSIRPDSVIRQATEEYRRLYISSFQTYNRGDLQNAELLARAVKHLCRASWFDAKIKYLESHSEDVPHLPGLGDEVLRNIEQGVGEVQTRLSRMKLTGLADRFGSRCRKHLERLFALPDRDTLLGETFFKASYEYCLATEALHEYEFSAQVARRA